MRKTSARATDDRGRGRMSAVGGDLDLWYALQQSLSDAIEDGQEVASQPGWAL